MTYPYYRLGDFYFDTTGKQLYVCTNAGYSTASGLTPVSAWTVVGGSIITEAYNNAHSYAQGSIVWIDTTVTIGVITILPGTYLCILGVPTSGTANQIPQFPLPTSGSVYWRCISFGAAVVNVCTSGGNQQVYGNFSGSF